MLLEGHLVESGEPARLVIAGSTVQQVEQVENGPDVWIAPGLIDIQVNGYGGHDVNVEGVTPADIIELTHALWRKGVTAFCPTIITQSEAYIGHCLRTIVAARDSDPLIAHAIPAIHVEGPYISAEDGPRGAHLLEHIRPPSIAEYQRWQAVAGGRVGIITLAPEHAGSNEYIRTVAADGILVSIGHTAATGEQIRTAVEAGARLSTHLGNGAHARIARHPNYIWDQLAEDRLSASFICDGHHLPPSVMKTMLRAKGCERSVLISDSVAIAGLAAGIYETPVGGKVELLPNGRLNLYGTPYLAGSSSSLPECIAQVVRHTDATLAQAVMMASTQPAKLLGLERGTTQKGASADLTLFTYDETTGSIVIQATVVRGEMVYQRPS